MFEKLELENFTVFEKASFEWATGINVFVGANGTGKTHLLKLLYCLPTACDGDYVFSKELVDVFRLDGKIRQLFSVKRNKNRKLPLRPLFQGTSVLSNGVNIKLFQRDLANKKPAQTKIDILHKNSCYEDVVFIPAKEVLSFAPGFLQLYDRFNLPFDKTYRDIIDFAYTPHQNQVDEGFHTILPILEKVMGGSVSVQGDTFLLNGRTMHLVAEGHRKLALIWQLIRNGSIASGTTLFWDEPEANLNPTMMQDVVKVLLMLVQSGVQIFVATHSDAFMRELDYQKNGVATRFFALEKTDHGVVPHPAERYIDVKPNPIEDEYLRLYDLEIQRSLGIANA